ncbi:MAG: aminomethyl-transferring glycine dehydrogenase subunit GcvPB [Candidatus Omnitrophica bacterium]|nr:aminomethyl-transferring glycine dehydrogenase subunit GcvPB [Candidatus Omnitrophota bacterium]
MTHTVSLIFEKSKEGKQGWSLPCNHFSDVEIHSLVEANLLRRVHPQLPSVSEPEIVRHYVTLSQKNFSVDTHFYPLGSCTMKYNPKLNEDAARLEGFAKIHPYQPEDTVQGMLHLLYDLEQSLREITGMDRFTLQPAAGAHGELCGMMLVKAYHDGRGDKARTEVIVPDSSHGTNPASAALFGFTVLTVKSDARGRVDLSELKKLAGPKTACLMLTNPNTFGLFEDEIREIQKCIHEAGGLLYYDGANMNALLGLARPGDMGFDIVHLNLHKTFSTPHGGGGPGAGPVGVKKKLIPYLPIPLVEQKNGTYFLNYDVPETIGRLRSFYGNVGMHVRAYTFIRRLGREGLAQASRDAILNANYIKKKIEKEFAVPHPEFCMHEFVAQAVHQNNLGVHATDIAKRLLDFGYHAPTIYFPLIVPEAMMIEPTESESKETLDSFIDVMNQIAREAVHFPDRLKQAPATLEISRPDDVAAARKPVLTYKDYLGAAHLHSEKPEPGTPCPC